MGIHSFHHRYAVHDPCPDRFFQRRRGCASQCRSGVPIPPPGDAAGSSGLIRLRLQTLSANSAMSAAIPFQRPRECQYRFLDLQELPDFDRARVQFRTEFFNLINHPNFGAHTTYDGSNPGELTTAGTSRQVQFALKFLF